MAGQQAEEHDLEQQLLLSTGSTATGNNLGQR
jgi:hypothetical protein